LNPNGRFRENSLLLAAFPHWRCSTSIQPHNGRDLLVSVSLAVCEQLDGLSEAAGTRALGPHLCKSTWLRQPLSERHRPRDIERMVDHWLHTLQEPHGVRKAGVKVERGFVDPAGVKKEQPRIARGPEGLDGEATGFGARGSTGFASKLPRRLPVPREHGIEQTLSSPLASP
jgi:hypothetical protein